VLVEKWLRDDRKRKNNRGLTATIWVGDGPLLD